MKKILFLAVMVVTLISLPKEVKAEEIYKAKATAYSYNSGTTATGTIPTEGRTVASKREYFGKVMQIWLDDGDGLIKPENFLGSYVVEDIGAEPIKKGYVIDVFIKDYDRAVNFGCKRIIYKVVDANG